MIASLIERLFEEYYKYQTEIRNEVKNVNVLSCAYQNYLPINNHESWFEQISFNVTKISKVTAKCTLDEGGMNFKKVHTVKE